LVIDPAPFCPRISLAEASITQTRRERNPSAKLFYAPREQPASPRELASAKRDPSRATNAKLYSFFHWIPASEQPASKKIARRIGEQLFWLASD
jgi:hypothetical protein